ncbi:MAG: hypothetical protein LW870_08510 [Pirellula sp.]|jgi:hypothetical protein|nr:hypothetical protein [Pirellula sp.]
MKSFVIGIFGVLSLALHVGCCGGPMGNCGNHCGRSITAAHCGLGCDVGCNAVCGNNACDVGCEIGCGGALTGLRSRLASSVRMNHCNSGCGEVYWDEQINERPVCDPCGCNNEFVGGAGCVRCPGALHRLRQLWGFRYTPSDCTTCSSEFSDGCGHAGCTTCSNCDHGVSHEAHTMTSSMPATSSREHATHSRKATINSEPTPAKQPVSEADENDREPSVIIPPRNQSIEVGSGRRTVPATSASKTSRMSKPRANSSMR